DTCHAHAAGEELPGVVERILDVVGAIDVVHCNSSRDLAGTGADRHANIETGRMDPEVILAMVKASRAPVVIFETPWPAIVEDIAWLRARL
ncbi:MAG: TIM barrel protein, partial [Actinomycetota bacterium]